MLDINGSMLGVGAERAAKRRPPGTIDFMEASAESLPYPDRTFDGYTIAFGIRNVPRIPLALSEAHRVLKTGGRFLCLEFAPVDTPVLDKIYDAYSFNLIPASAGRSRATPRATAIWWNRSASFRGPKASPA